MTALGMVALLGTGIWIILGMVTIKGMKSVLGMETISGRTTILGVLVTILRMGKVLGISTPSVYFYSDIDRLGPRSKCKGLGLDQRLSLNLPLRHHHRHQPQEQRTLGIFGG